MASECLHREIVLEWMEDTTTLQRYYCQCMKCGKVYRVYWVEHEAADQEGDGPLIGAEFYEELE